MPNRCVAPNCTSNAENKYLAKDDKIRTFSFPGEQNEDLRRKWVNALPLKDYAPSKHSVLCAKHFTQADFKDSSSDSNQSRYKKKEYVNKPLKRVLLKEGAVPSQWPGCPPLLSKTITPPRTTTLASAAAREERESVRDEIRHAIRARVSDECDPIVSDECDPVEIVDSDSFQTVPELAGKIDLPDDVYQVVQNESMTIFAFDPDGGPVLKI